MPHKFAQLFSATANCKLSDNQTPQKYIIQDLDSDTDLVFQILSQRQSQMALTARCLGKN